MAMTPAASGARAPVRAVSAPASSAAHKLAAPSMRHGNWTNGSSGMRSHAAREMSNVKMQ